MTIQSDKYNLSKLNFLVVEDNKHMRFIINDILRGFGVKQIIEASDGSDAFREMRSSNIHIAIVDWIMEPLDGYDFVRLVRTAPDSPNKHLPIIMLTAYTESYRIIAARDAGANEFLAKPISATSLFQRIVSIIKYPRSFVKIGSYFGPDRRRHLNATFDGDERRIAQSEFIESTISIDKSKDFAPAKLNQNDIDSLFG
jgi:two-component system, chemotaxis family, chemotaxis protein CheY